MKYIVWRNPFSSYSRNQGGGYFVRWKSKVEDEWSPNWFDANKYKNLGSAIDRLGLKLDTMRSLDDFFAKNVDKSYYRNKSISEILDEPNSNAIHFITGHIDKIDGEGKFLGNAGDEVIEYVKNVIKLRTAKIESEIKAYLNLGINKYIDESVSDDEFWNDYFKGI